MQSAINRARPVGPIRPKRSLPLILLLASLVLGHLEAGEVRDLDSILQSLQYARLPLQLRQNHLAVEAVVNDRNCSFMVDTGWSISSIDDSGLGRLPAISESGLALRDPVFRKLDPGLVTVIENLRFGSLHFPNQPLMLKSIKRRGTTELGVLGGDFFIRKFCLLDCGGGRLYVRDLPLLPSGRDEIIELLRNKGFLELPMTLAGSFVVGCAAAINGIEAKLLVDSGAEASVLDRGLVDRLQIPRSEKRTRSIRGAGKIGAAWLYSARLESLRLGGMTLTNVPIGVADLSRWGIADEKAKGTDVQGLLGMDLLRARRAVIDYANGKLWLKPPTTP